MADNNGGNISKLAKDIRKKLLSSKDSFDALHTVTAEKDLKSPVTEVYTPDGVENKFKDIEPSTYEQNLDEQGNLLVNGSKDINEVLEQEAISEKKQALADAGIEIGNINVAKAVEQAKKSDTPEKDDKGDDFEL